MGEINFSTFQMLIASKEPGIKYIPTQKDFFKKLKATSNKLITDDGTVYKATMEIDDDCFWISVEHGKSNPCRKNLYDINEQKEKTNNRTKKQAELIHQSFFLYIFDDKILYLSNSKHKKLYENFISENTGENVIIKSIFIDIDEFAKVIKKINKISFSCFKNLFNEDSKEFKALEDLTGAHSPDSFTLEARYSEKDSYKILKLIKHIKKMISGRKEEKRVSGLIVQGLDEDGIETFYNTDAFRKTITIKESKNDEGVYDIEYVKQKLLERIHA